MATYLISYDIVRSPSEYPELWAQFDSDGAVKILLSEYLISTNESAGDLANRYLRHLDDNDRLFVCTANNWAYRMIKNETAAKRLLP